MSTVDGHVERFSSGERRKNSRTLSESESASYGGAVGATNDKPKRVRNRQASLQLQAALNAAEVINDADPTPENAAKMNLLKVRLAVLSRKAARELVDTRKQLRDALAAARAENERLTRQHERDTEEITRLRDICRTATGVTFDEIALRGQNGR
jgi:hypothetical protein